MRVFMSNKSATNNRCIDIISRLHTLSFWSLVLVQKIVALMSPQHSVVKALSTGAYAHILTPTICRFVCLIDIDKKLLA